MPRAVDGIPALVAALTAPGGPQFDRVFNILHGNRGGGEDGVLQGLLEALGVPYTGSGVLGSALSMDKIRTKQVWLALGLPTPAYVNLQRGEDVVAAAHKLGLPVIVKPACEGSSVGITRCFKDADLAAAVELAARYEGSLLVEQLIQGEEYTVGVLGHRGAAVDPHRAGRRVLRLPREVRRRGHAVPVPGPDGRGRAGTREPRRSRRSSRSAAAAGAASTSCATASGKPWLLEVNTAPGMTSHSLVPKAARQRGIEFDELVWRVLETSFARSPRRRAR